MQLIIETVQHAAKKLCKKLKVFVLIKYQDQELNLRLEKRANPILFPNHLNTFTIIVIVNPLTNHTFISNKNNTLGYLPECNLV